jgi:hypothetical protein
MVGLVDLARNMGGGGAGAACSVTLPAGWIASGSLSEFAAGDREEGETSGESVVVVGAADVDIDTLTSSSSLLDCAAAMLAAWPSTRAASAARTGNASDSADSLLLLPSPDIAASELAFADSSDAAGGSV